MARYKIVLAPPHVLEHFDAQIRSLVRLVHSNVEQLQTLAALRDALLPKLLSGEVRVWDVERLAGAMI